MLASIDRLLLGLSQRELAERLGMARNTITRYERGFLPRIPKYVALADTGLIAESSRAPRKSGGKGGYPSNISTSNR
jgi:transcriptional regulator with XRE-family HTH domain